MEIVNRIETNIDRKEEGTRRAFKRLNSLKGVVKQQETS